MKALFDVDTMQICITNACVLQCSGCTHLCGHHKQPYMMSVEYFKKVVDSLEGYPKMVGIIGGEPLLVPWIADCFRYLRSKFPREQLGLWSVFPEGEKFSKHREVIVETFGNIFLNDHKVDNIMHAPILVASGEYFDDPKELEAAAWHCWVQNAWSPGITPKGAFFCEVAGELDQLFNGPGGWDISEPQWWKRTPIDFAEQIRRSCSKCGGCMPLARRSSQDIRCDVSEGNFEALKGRSRKVDNGQVYLQKRGEFKFDRSLADNMYPDQRPYKDWAYRQRIAGKYEMYLTINGNQCWEPHLKEDGGYVPSPPPKAEPPSLFQIMSQGG